MSSSAPLHLPLVQWDLLVRPLVMSTRSRLRLVRPGEAPPVALAGPVAPPVSGVVFDLEAARVSGALVRVSRRVKDADKLEGFVLGVGSTWVLLGVLDPGVFLDGVALVRLADVRRVQVLKEEGSFVHRALQARGTWPVPVPVLDLSDTSTLLSQLVLQGELVGVHLERMDPDVCFIGVLALSSEGSLDMRDVDADAVWSRELLSWRLKKVTRLDVGGEYMRSLALVAGTDPDA